MAVRTLGRSEASRWVLLIWGGGFALWELLARAQVISPIFFPPPSRIGLTLWRDVAGGELLPHVSVTILRTVPAVLLGAGSAVLLGLGIAVSRRLRAVSEPFIAALHPIPKLALLPLFMVVVGIGETSKLLVAAVAAFFPMVINTIAGVRQIPRVRFEVAESCGAGPVRVLTRVVLPSALPMILAGLRLAVNIGFVTIIAVEMVSGGDGLGARVWLSWQVLRTEQLWATLVAIACMGMALNVFLEKLESWLVPWREGQQETG